MEKLICVGKNYLAHAGELGDAIPTEPTYFFKPPSVLLAYDQPTGEVTWPAEGDLHYETELVLRLGPDAKSFTHYTVGLDMTRRDLQSELKKGGLPWEKAKVFKNAAVIARWLPFTTLDHVLDLDLRLEVNGQTKQNAKPREMRWAPDYVIKDLPRYFPVQPGDLLFTGTPQGVGPVHHGDVMRLSVGEISLTLKVARQ